MKRFSQWLVFGVFLGVFGGWTLNAIIWAVTGSWEIGDDLFLIVIGTYVFGLCAGMGLSSVFPTSDTSTPDAQKPSEGD